MEELDKIQADYKSVDECFKRMLIWWLNNGTNRTWKALADAIETENKKVLADEIRARFL